MLHMISSRVLHRPCIEPSTVCCREHAAKGCFFFRPCIEPSTVCCTEHAAKGCFSFRPCIEPSTVCCTEHAAKGCFFGLALSRAQCVARSIWAKRVAQNMWARGVAQSTENDLKVCFIQKRPSMLPRTRTTFCVCSVLHCVHKLDHFDGITQDVMWLEDAALQHRNLWLSFVHPDSPSTAIQNATEFILTKIPTGNLHTMLLMRTLHCPTTQPLSKHNPPGQTVRQTCGKCCSVLSQLDKTRGKVQFLFWLTRTNHAVCCNILLQLWLIVDVACSKMCRFKKLCCKQLR